jgi:ATP-dependent Zn protease
MPAQARRIAIHEAAHAVVSRLVGLKSGGATIIPDANGNAGKSFVRDEPDNIATVITCLSGRAAEEIVFGFAFDYGCSIDDAKALQLLAADGFREGVYLKIAYGHCLEDARKLIARNRAAVERVARALLAQETLTGAEIDQLMVGLR